MKTKYVTGEREILYKLRNNKVLPSAIERGLLNGGKFLFREAQELVPVQFGNLKASGFVRKEGSGYKTDVQVGYTSKYALYVHENPNALHGAAFNAAYAEQIAKARLRTMRTGHADKTYFRRGEKQQYKFLERPMKEKRGQILAIIAGKAI